MTKIGCSCRVRPELHIPEHCRTIKINFFTKYLVTSEKSRTFAPQFALRILRNLLTV